MTEQIEITRADDRQRYEIHVDGALAGWADFRDTPTGKVLFPATEVDPASGGRGPGSRLIDAAVRDVADQGRIAVPRCPFVVSYLRKHEIPGLVVEFPTAEEAAAHAAAHAAGRGGDEAAGHGGGAESASVQG